MDTPEPTDLLETPAELRRRYPAWRLGQLMANVAGWADQDLWDIEDEVLLATARSHLEAAVTREPEVCA